jgi:iron complex outermembrane receptor protein
MITGAAIAAATSGAYAQTAPAAGDAAGTNVQEFVVTGSRIPQPNLTSISPVTAVSSAEIKLSGTTRVEDLINQLPQVIADQGGNLSNGASGTATISLRDLGAPRTLVLVNGRRLGPGDPGLPVADLNFIPATLIDRVDVLTGGASSTYGSDAVAGVVNFIMKKDFEGLQVDVNYGGYENGNYDKVSQAANHALNYPVPTSPVYDGQTVNVTVTFGANSPDGKGNVEGYLDYRHIDPVTEGTRDYSFCSQSLTNGGKGFKCGGSETAANATILTYDANFNSFGAYQVSPTGKGVLNPFTGAPNQLYNYAPENYFQRNDERYSGGFFGHYDITPHITAYSEFMFMHDQSTAQIAESGDFGTNAVIPCNNPLLSAQEVQALCVKPGYSTAANPTAGTAVNDFILRRNVEGGPREAELTHTDYRAVVGLKGDLDANWHFDVYGSYYQSSLQSVIKDYFSNSKLALALDAVPGPNGTAVCASGGSCVPYNPFTPGGVTAAQLAYLEVPGITIGDTTEQVVSGAITGDLTPYGGKSPWAHEGVGVSFGAEYRRETLSSTPDEEQQIGDLAGSGGKISPTNGAFDVKEVFGEVRIPIAQDLPLIKDLSLESGYRFSSYSSAGDTNSYKVGAEWSITDEFRLRGGFNRAVRAPNIDELYVAQNVGLDGNTDNCSGAKPVYTAAQCARTGVSASQYGNISPNAANQYNGLLGGNPNLKPETADTYTVGFVVTPIHSIPGMSFSIDYFDIKISNVIQTFGADNIIDQCATTGISTYCDLIHRAPGSGSLWLSKTGYVIDTLQNLGYLKTSGLDFTFNYKTRFKDFNLPDWGGLGLAFLGTYTKDYQIQGAPGTATLNCVSKYGDTCQGTASPQSGPLPAFKAKTRLTWTTPVNGLEVSVDWRYVGPIDVDSGAQGTLDSHIIAYNYFDLAASWRVKDRYTVRVGCNNIFDRDPPVIGSGELPATIGNGNTFAQVYDALGRYLFMGVTAAF